MQKQTLFSNSNFEIVSYFLPWFQTPLSIFELTENPSAAAFTPMADSRLVSAVCLIPNTLHCPFAKSETRNNCNLLVRGLSHFISFV